MKYERKSSHSIYDHKYHICWITKYRYQVIRGQVAIRLRELIRQVCKQQSVEILEGHVRPEHIHLFVSVPPHISISKLVQLIKGRTGRKMLQEYETLRQRYYGGHLWTRGFYSATSGNVTDEMIQEYVRNQDKKEFREDERFQISE